MARNGDNEGLGFGGSWYFVVTCLSFGLLAWVPFAHAAGYLSDRRLALQAWLYGIFAGLSLFLFLIAPADADDNPIGIGHYEIAAGFVVLAGLIGAGTYSQAKVRRRIYGRPQRRDPLPPRVDPAIGMIVADRARRAKSRDIAATDPLMAHELRIGRPDIPNRRYADGGLVDINAAPATAIAQACELPFPVAEAIVAARPYTTVDDVITMVEIPLSAWPVVRDRGIVISLDGQM